MSLNFDGIVPVPIGEFDGVKPTTTLTSMSTTQSWIDTNIIGVASDNMNIAPLPIMCIDTQTGGSYIFYSPSGESASKYEYRLKNTTDSDFSNWIPCTSFRISLPNATYLKGNIQVRHIADSKLASDILTNDADFTFYEFEINILSIYFTGYTLNVKFISKNTAMILITNGFRNGDASKYTNPEGLGPFSDYPNPSVISFPLDKYKGSFQRIQLQGLAGGYITPIDDSKYSVTVPN